MIVVRINDRGPYGNDRVISLSRAAADRLNTSNNTKVRIDPIIVAQDGSLSGPGNGLYHSRQQTYALPAPPDLSGGAGASSASGPQGDILPVSKSTLKKRRFDRRAGNQQRFPRRTNDLSAWCTGKQRTDTCTTARCYSSVDNACNLACNGDTASRLAKRQRQLYGASRGR